MRARVAVDGLRGALSALLPPAGEAFAFVGLGSNLGDRLANLQQAVDLLAAAPRVRVDALSSVYETAPVGGPEQGSFLNMAARLATRLSPRGLLATCLGVERALGRVRAERWGPRSIDVDILLYGGRVVAAPGLQIPHPRLRERPFVLIPLIEVAPGMRLPDGTSLTAVLARLAPVEGVTMVGRQVTEPS